MPEIFSSDEKNKTNSPVKPNHKKCSRKHVDEYSEVMKKERPSNGFFHAFAPKPTKIAFDSQDKDEQIILLLRQHPITQLGKIAIFIIALLFPIFISPSSFLEFLAPKFHIAFTLGWYTLLIGYFIEIFLSWFFNVYIITDERIIDVDFLSLIYKNISSAKIDNIEDITATTSGALASMIDYGDVIIQTAAEKREFEFSSVPHPARVTKLLNELILEEEKEKIEGRVN